LIAFASGEDESSARRLSLKRALAVRDFFKSLGVSEDRITPQAKGNQGTANGSGHADRVDIFLN
jgi:outer membrane protein OmpA-like peptidoglycan-associated protein